MRSDASGERTYLEAVLVSRRGWREPRACGRIDEPCSRPVYVGPRATNIRGGRSGFLCR